MTKYTYKRESEHLVVVYDEAGNDVGVFDIKPILYWETSVIIEGDPRNRYRAVEPVIFTDVFDGGHIEDRVLHRGETIIGQIPALPGSYEIYGTVFSSSTGGEGSHAQNIINEALVETIIGRASPLDGGDYMRWWVKLERMISRKSGVKK